MLRRPHGLGMSEGAVKVAVHRLRRRYRDLLREEIAQTVAGPEEVEDEIRCLFPACSTASGSRNLFVLSL